MKGVLEQLFFRWEEVLFIAFLCKMLTFRIALKFQDQARLD